MLLEGGTSSKRIPDTLQAMIAARIDRLRRNEKRLLQRAAVIGRIFWEGAVAPPDARRRTTSSRSSTTCSCATSSPARAARRSRASSAYRFKHVLIRDVAYAGLAKGARAELHQQVADWLHGVAGEELVEIRAYHLDHAATLLEELDGEAPEELAKRAAGALEKAGRRALAQEANQAARRLLVRSVELEPTLQRRFLAARAARRLADLPAQAVEMERVFADATEAGDVRLQGLALTALAENALLRDADLPRGRELVEQALVLLDDAEPEDRIEALATRARIGWWLGDLDDDERWNTKALEVAREIGRKDLEASAVRRARELGDRAARPRSRDAARGRGARARRRERQHHRPRLGARLAGPDRRAARPARRGGGRARTAPRSSSPSPATSGRSHASTTTTAGSSGDAATSPAAERRFRDAIRILKPLEDRGTLCESQRGLAQVLVSLKKIDEAERYALEARETVGPHDTISRATTRMALGIVRAAQGRDEEAEALLREAVAVVDGKPLLLIRRELVTALARFLRERDRIDEAEQYEAELADYEAVLAPEPEGTALIAWDEPSSGDSEITVAGRSKRPSASRSGSARSVPSP